MVSLSKPFGAALLIVSIFLGCFLSPFLCVAGWISEPLPAQYLLVGLSIGALTLAAQYASFPLCLGAGLLPMVSIALSRLAVWSTQPAVLLLYELAVLVFIPFLIWGLSRMWHFLVGGPLFAAFLALLSFSLLKTGFQIGEYLIENSLSPLPLQILDIVPSPLCFFAPLVLQGLLIGLLWVIRRRSQNRQKRRALLSCEDSALSSYS